MRIRIEAEINESDLKDARLALRLLEVSSVRYDALLRTDDSETYNKRVVKGHPLINFINVD